MSASSIGAVPVAAGLEAVPAAAGALPAAAAGAATSAARRTRVPPADMGGSMLSSSNEFRDIVTSLPALWLRKVGACCTCFFLAWPGAILGPAYPPLTHLPRPPPRPTPCCACRTSQHVTKYATRLRGGARGHAALARGARAHGAHPHHRRTSAGRRRTALRPFLAAQGQSPRFWAPGKEARAAAVQDVGGGDRGVPAVGMWRAQREEA